MALFVALFLLVLQALALATHAFLTIPDPEHALLAALVVQGVLVLIAALAAGWAMLRWVDGRPLGELGFRLRRSALPELGWGLAIGALAMATVVLALALVGVVRFVAAPGTPGAWAWAMVAALLWLAIPAFAEEALFRGYLFRTLIEGIGPVAATLLLSALFAAVHGANPAVSAMGTMNIFLAGVMLSLAVIWTGSLWLASALHLGWNWAMAAPLDLPVSGLDLFDAPLYSALVTGPAWLTGGEFGPEGGVAGTVALALAVGILWKKYGEGRDDDVRLE